MASGYDLSNKHPFRLMQGRLGIFDKRPFNPQDNHIEGIDHQSTILRQNGGNRQQERMILSKRRSLDRAVWSAYQAAEVVRTDATDKRPVRALINPDKTKQDYDEKTISVGYEFGFKTGSVFEWLGTKTHWLIYLQDLTELAYFRGHIRRCSYYIEWDDEDGRNGVYAAVVGPQETRINSSQKHGLSIDNPNYSLNILLPNNEKTLKYFKRYSKFYLQNLDICWRVEAVDWISTPNIISITAVEYYANETEDDIENGIVGGLIVSPEEIIDDSEAISGETFIKVKREYEYTFTGAEDGAWEVVSLTDAQPPVSLETFGKKVIIKWCQSYSGQFELKYGKYGKTIIVESLF